MLWIARTCFGLLVSGILCSAAAAEPPAPVKGPLSPAESQKIFRLDDGLTIELVAAEPDVIDPVAIAFGPAGELWVVEMRDYPHGPKPGEPPLSKIRKLTDADGDGRYETSSTFAENLLFPTGVLPWQDGLIVTLSGKVAFIADRDGDGKAEHQETWFTGFTEENSQLRANHPTLGPDGWIYIANGLRGGTVRSHLPQTKNKELAVPISGHDFRFHPITGEFEPISGHGQFGLTFDDAGRRFVTTNRNPCIQVVLEERYLKRNPFLAVSSVVHDVAAAGEASRVYPICNAWTTSTLHAGQFTAACGVLIYRGDALPQDYYGNAFTCDPTGSLVHREVITESGVALTGKSPYQDREFLASPDSWFRPVNLTYGPDGALYVVDMYRAVIEHPQFMPEELKTRRDLLEGTDRGRIWRIRPAAKNSTMTQLPGAATSDLVALLGHPNAWQRETAQRLLLQRAIAGDAEVASQLLPTVKSGKTPESRFLSLGLLQVLQQLPVEAIKAALHDSAPVVAAAALRAYEPTLMSNPAALPDIAPLNASQNPLVRFQLALSLGESEQPGRIAALTDLVVESPADPWLRLAVASSAGDQTGAILTAALKRWIADGKVPDGGLELAQQFGEVVGSQRDPKVVVPILQAAFEEVPSDNRELMRLTAACVRGIGGGLARRGQSWPAFCAEHLQGVGFGLVMLPGTLLQHAEKAGNPLDLRTEALRMFRWSPTPGTSLPFLLDLVSGNEPAEIKLAALETAGPFLTPEAADKLVSIYGTLTPTVRRAVLDSLLATETGAGAILTAVETKQIQVAEIEPTRASRLSNHRNTELKQRATALFAAGNADRVAVLKQYEAALTRKGDELRGRAIFEKNCVTCHRIANIGVNVGPDIGDTRDKTPATLLTNILDPNKAVDNNYFGYTAVLEDGRVFTGIITAETSSSITLKQPEGKTETLLRADLEELKASGQSLMPVGVEKNVTVEQMADLIAFLKNWRYLDGNVPLP